MHMGSFHILTSLCTFHEHTGKLSLRDKSPFAEELEKLEPQFIKDFRSSTDLRPKTSFLDSAPRPRRVCDPLFFDFVGNKSAIIDRVQTNL